MYSKLKIIRLFLLSLAFPVITNHCYSQDSKTLGEINIASPNSASLGKYVDIPVSYYTGIPEINIPLHTITSGSLKLSIGLSYHASGLKVEENDSWVGAGWTLNVGGVITRTVKDKPDEKQTSSLAQTYGYFSDFGWSSYWQNSNPDCSNVDAEPDLFFFNFNGYTGKFWFNDDRTPVISPEQDFKIEYSYTPGIWTNSPGTSAGLGRCIESFVITTPDGTKYYFGIPKTPVQSPYCDPIEVTSSMTVQSGTSYSQVISSWYLNKIVSRDGNFSINLNYKRDKYAFYTFTNLPVLSNGTIGVNYKYNLVKNLMAGVVLSEINTSTEKVDFIPGAARQDLSRWASGLDESMADNINQNSPVLGSINFADASGNSFKKFNFSYDYFVDNTTPTSSYFPGVVSDKKRLKLLSVQEVSADGTTSTPPYKFDYFAEQVPRKLSFSRDHWGYNNGIITNSQLYPALSDNNGVLNISANLGIANRESAWPAMRAGTLKQITYPTGGTGSFEFEPNTFTVKKTINGQPVLTDTIVGGLRIKKITLFDSVVNKSVVTSFSFLATGTNKSSGVLYSIPTYIQIFRNDLVKKTNFWGNPNGNGCWDTYDSSYSATRNYIFSDNPLRPMESTQGYHIGYGEVKVSQVNNGFSIYRYSVTPPWLIDRNYLAITHIDNPGPCSVTIPNYPAAPLPEDFNRGELTYVGNYDQSGLLLSEKTFTNTYQDNPVTTPGESSFSFTIGAGSFAKDFTVKTNYELKTARKTGSTVTERTYQPGGSYLEKHTQTLYESQYHHEPTTVITTDSKSRMITKKTKYAFDYRVPLFDTISDCYTGSANFINFADSLLLAGGYSSSFLNCWGYTDPTWTTTQQNYLTSLYNSRKNYIDRRKTNYTRTDSLPVFQLNHYTAKANANSELKPLLWMQDIYMNEPVETSSWQNSLLTGATYTRYSNNRADSFGVYADKTLKIDLESPVSTFTASAVASDNVSIVKDSRYIDLANYDFDKGNVISVLGRDSIPVSYEWAYNQTLPVVKISNAVNKYKEISQPGIVNRSFSFYLGPSNPTSGTLQKIFTQTQSGTITISIPTPPTNAGITGYFTLSGPSNKTGYLCASGTGGAGCSSVPSYISYTNMPAGQYTLTANVNTGFQSFTFLSTLSYSYEGTEIIQSGIKEFFYEGFEGSSGGNVMTGLAHTGTNLYNGSYTVSYIPPAGKTYTIQWWDKEGSEWIRNQQAYTSNMVLTGIIDDIRVFPTDALMTTYTYNPLTGITSQLDPNGKALYYDYDGFGRLAMVRDQDKNVLKKICYDYAGQPGNCNISVVASYTNVAKSGLFYRNNCSAFYIGNTVTYTVPAGTYTSYISQEDADQKAQNDVNMNGPAYANTHGTCTANVSITGQHSFSCSSSGGTSSGSGVITGPPGYVTTVNLSAYGSSGTYTTYVTLSGGVSMSRSVSNGSTSFTFTMPSSGSVNWSGSISCPNYYGNGSVSAY